MIYAHFFQCYMQFSELGNMYMDTIYMSLLSGSILRYGLNLLVFQTNCLIFWEQENAKGFHFQASWLILEEIWIFIVFYASLHSCPEEMGFRQTLGWE